VFFLNILDKIKKGEIKNNNEFKSFLLSKCVTIMSKIYKIKRVSGDAYQKCLKDNDRDSDGKKIYKFKIHFFSDDDTYFKKIKIRQNKITSDLSLDENKLMFVEFKNKFKEISYEDLKENNLEEIIKFLNNELISNEKLFLNVELINGEDELKDSYDLTNELQKYFVEGNTILSYGFLKKIFKNVSNNELSENYLLKIMTQDVEMFTLDKTQSIIIFTNEDELSFKLN
jgi:hypothetical protein